MIGIVGCDGGRFCGGQLQGLDSIDVHVSSIHCTIAGVPGSREAYFRRGITFGGERLSNLPLQ